MRLRLWLLLALAVAAVPHAADACPAGSACLKYRRMPPPPPQVVLRYARTVHATLDRVDRASVVRFLTGSTWDLVVGGRAERIRFVDPRAGHFARPPETERAVLIREVERTRAGLVVGVDGVMFMLTTCRVGRGVSSCLEQTNAGAFGGTTYGGL